MNQRGMDQKTFIFGTPARGDNFTDREKETHRLHANFTHGINTILISPRRWGKTSLVKRVIDTVKSDEIKMVYMDVFACRNAEEFYARFAESVVRQTASRREEWMEHISAFLQRFNPKFRMSAGSEIEWSLTFEVAPKKEDADGILDLPEKIARKKNYRIVVCIDEFQQTGEFKDSLTFQKQLRTVWQHQERVCYCLFGSKKHLMAELFERSSSPFYKFGDIMFLEKIPTPDWVNYIRSRFSSTGKEISEALATEICRLVENQSNYVQELSWILWVNTDKEATEEKLRESFQELMDHNSLLFERMTETLTASQMNFLKAVAEGIHSEFTKQEILSTYQLGTASNVKRLKDSLLQKDLIDISRSEVYISDPVLRHWLIRVLFS